MWPWEHLAFGYLLYALLRRALGWPRPTDLTAVAVAVGTQFPDLVDKPLGWVFHVFAGGRALAHSAVFASVAVPFVLVAGYRRGRERIAAVVALAYLSHLAGDVIGPLSHGEPPSARFLAWPFVDVGGGADARALTHVLEQFHQFRAYLASPAGRWYLLLEVGAVAVVVLLWVCDGAPGTHWLRRLIGGGGRTEDVRSD